MRISDWSADVCSSDLGAWRRVAPLAEAMGTLTPADVEAFALACLAYADMSESRAIVAREGSTPTKVTDRGGTSVVSPPAVAQGRKRVVRGKSGPVRVGPGGRRNTKKKKQQKDT